MIIDRSKGYFISKNNTRHPNVSYVDDLSYYLYIIDTGFQPRFTQVGFMKTYSDRHGFYEKSIQFIKLEKLKKLKKLIYEN
ncbi:MAG: hypothetical protein ACOC3V_02635 [bacterium]